MKLNKIAALCALAFAGVSGSAMAALTPAQATVLDNANAAGRVVFISGASAVQKGFVGIINTIFTGTKTYYSLASSKGSAVDKADYVAVAGTLAAGTGAWAGQETIVIYRVRGGSVFGVNPVARDEAIEALNVVSTACGTSGLGTDASPYQCTTTTRHPDAGVSDVAPVLFQSPINTEGETAAAALSATELSVLTSTPIYGLAFGIPVTNTVGAGVKFTRSAVSAIMAGNVGSWDAVDSTQSGDIVVCRRVPGSGTQAVMNLWAGNYPCSTTAANIPTDRDASGAWDATARKFTVTAGGGYQVVENSTSDDVKSCLDKAVTGGTYNTKDRDGAAVAVEFVGAGHKAIGVLSMDSLKDSKTGGNWQFRALDGAGTYTGNDMNNPVATNTTGKAPTKAVYENGDWDLQGWISFNIPARTTGAKLELLNKFVANAKDPAILSSITDLKNVAMAIPGGDYTGPQVLDAAYLDGNQCAPYNRNYND